MMVFSIRVAALGLKFELRNRRQRLEAKQALGGDPQGQP